MTKRASTGDQISAICSLLQRLPPPAYVYDHRRNAIAAINPALARCLGTLSFGSCEPSPQDPSYLTRLVFPRGNRDGQGGTGKFLLLHFDPLRRPKTRCFVSVEDISTHDILSHGWSIGVLEATGHRSILSSLSKRSSYSTKWSWSGAFTNDANSLSFRRRLPSCLGYARTRPIECDQWLKKVHPEDVDRLTKELNCLRICRKSRELIYRLRDANKRFTPIRDVFFFSTDSKQFLGSYIERRSIPVFASAVRPKDPATERALHAVICSMIQKKDELQRDMALALHDDVLSPLLSVRLRLEDALQSTKKSLTTKLKPLIAEITTIANVARNISTHTWPPALEFLGPLEAISALVAKLKEETGLSIHFDAPHELPVLSKALSITLYRIVQEALMNISRHANATQVWVLISLKSRVLLLSIKDNGVGILPSPKSKAFGLVGMKERAISVGGQVEVSRLTPKGTQVQCRLPIPPQKQVNQ